MIILASASPRRKELLELMGLKFVVRTAKTEEFTDEREPGEIVKALSSKKAEAVLSSLAEDPEIDPKSDKLIIAADTLVFADGKILGKPKDRGEAFEMLELLQGRSHEVRTGVTLVYITHDSGLREKILRCSFQEVTGVTFNPMTEDEINGLIDTGEPMDKAGAYGIQGFSAKFIKGIEGDYYNVMGLPVASLYMRLKEIGFNTEG